ncbi:MAG: nitroreductase family protein [Bryobacterales bacterium]|nr:nitroreductase family protein [Bryobacterales bacterium]
MINTSTLDPIVAAILEATVRAPSSHNTQPWRFQARQQTIQLYADRTRALPVSDPHDRELIISCGCALLHLRVAAAGIGVASTVRLWCQPDDPDHIATITLDPAGAAPASDAELDNYIEVRRTYRKRFEPRQIPDSVLDELCAAATAEGASLTVLSSEELRHQTAALIADGDALLWHNPSWRRELAQWMHPRRTGDGLTVPWLVAPFTQAVVRSFDMGDGEAAKDRQYADESPVLAVLTTAGDTPIDWLCAGQALARVLLQACQHGVQASYLNQPIQLPELRLKLQTLLGDPGNPQILLRMGYPAGEVPPSPRRHFQEFLDS